MDPLNNLVSKNQSIKIVPSVEDTLETIGLNVHLEQGTLLWLEQLKFKWRTWKKSPATHQHFDLFFQITPDPYRVALVCIVKCEEFKDCKPKTLPYYIIETINNWSKSNGTLPEDFLKLPAFHIATNQRNQHFLNLIIKTYHVSTIKDVIVPIVKDMMRNDNCKLASQIVIAMDLFEYMPVEELLFPLILQDKANMIDEYLLECPNQVQSLLLFLDNLLDRKFSTRTFVQNFIDQNNIINVKYDKIHYKPLGKLVARLCNKFNIPIETCKNLSKNRKTGGLRYLIHQKYVENNVSLSVWEDLVKDSLQKSNECVQEFIDILVDYDINEALKWATQFQVPESNLPLALKKLTLSDVKVEEECWDENNSSVGNFHKLTISIDDILLIDTGEKLYDLVSNLVNCSIIAIDCEWKPSFGASQSQVAIIQIATMQNVYLIDTLKLNDKQYLSLWHNFHKSLLENAEIIKLGFGFEQDLKELKGSIIGLGNIKVKGEGLLDLSLLWRSLINYGLTLPSKSDCEGNSLSSLVQACFHLPLEKSEQCSNWELRPLRHTQVYYAALDAYVLLEIYNYLQKACLEQKINFDEISNDVMLQGKLKSTKKTKVADHMLANSTLQLKNTMDVRMLLEPELSHLLTYLRYCGIDTIVMNQNMLWHDAVKLALSDDRYILTTKLKLSPTAKLPQSSILNIGKDGVKEQLQKILSNFSIVVNKSDVLSRCLRCNDIDLKKLTSNEVKNICDKFINSSKYNVNICRYSSDNDDEDIYNNFLSDSDGDDVCLYQPVKKYDDFCLTSKGMTVEIGDVNKLLAANKPATLCEDCGKLYWDEDLLLKNTHEVILLLTNNS